MHVIRAAAALVAVLALAGCGGGSEPSNQGGPETAPRATAPTAKAVPADAVVETSEGTFTIRLDVAHAPNTVASFEQLARDGYFDGTVFHRIVPGFVIQGGDPTGTGTGGPGYTTVDPPPANARYVKGVVAMAKTGAEAPGTAGSQFFVVTGADAGLPPDYALLGKVVAGLPVVERIGALGDDAEQPTKRVEIQKITIRPT
jgi:cyclophilin family peptidyl-prolyl cis-trans isomerase